MPHTVNPLATVAQAASSPNPAPAGFAEASAATAETVPPAPALTIPSELQNPEPKTAIRTAVVSSPIYSAPARPRSKGWMPIALVSLSMLGGLLGAGFGLSLRLASTSAQTSGETLPRFAPHLFSREQSFPAETDWPISETPQFFTTDPTPVEEPVYRTNSSAAEDPAPNFPTLPEDPLPAPSLPIKNPAAVQATTAPPLNQSVTPPSPTTTEPPDPLPIAPAVSDPPAAAQSIPAEPAPPVALPEVPEPAIPDLPVPNAPPAAPSLPAVNSSSKAIN